MAPQTEQSNYISFSQLAAVIGIDETVEEGIESNDPTKTAFQRRLSDVSTTVLSAVTAIADKTSAAAQSAGILWKRKSINENGEEMTDVTEHSEDSEERAPIENDISSDLSGDSSCERKVVVRNMKRMERKVLPRNSSATEEAYAEAEKVARQWRERQQSSESNNNSMLSTSKLRRVSCYTSLSSLRPTDLYVEDDPPIGLY
tara:strand:- start:706 stop:1311 length:606 start_codon:yes stop_codon:yes gene_type:complete